MSKLPIIIFEGIEGSGKTTQVNNVTKYLISKKKKFIRIREPGGSKNAEKIRNLILSNKSNFNKFTDLLLYLAARSENIENIINKNYKKKILLIDRFTFSTLAYQHYGFGISKKIINLINSYMLKKIKPDHIFLHIVDENNFKKRLKKRINKNRYDKFSFSFYKKVQIGFMKLLKNKKNVTIINTNKPIYINKIEIIDKIKKLI